MCVCIKMSVSYKVNGCDEYFGNGGCSNVWLSRTVRCSLSSNVIVNFWFHEFVERDMLSLSGFFQVVVNSSNLQ